MSLTWRWQTFTIIIGGGPLHDAAVVDGLVDNLGLFGIHFVDNLHGHISVTELKSGLRIHPEPGFPTLGLAARFAERAAHIDFHEPRKMKDEDRAFLITLYNQFIIGARLEPTARG